VIDFVRNICKIRKQMKGGYTMPCGCGRSPTGECLGWHSLTEEEYQDKLNQWNTDQKNKEDSE